MNLIYTTVALVIGFLLDFMLGDPHGMWHPIIAVGNLIAKAERGIRKVFPKTNGGELAGGVCLVVIVTVVSAGVPMLLVMLCYHIHWIVGICFEAVLCYFILATKSLKTESMKVAKALEQEGLTAGRKAVSMIVGRDTEELSEEGVIKAAVETIAENASDGVLAPMIYMAVGGPVLGFFYKAINTMDSMVGYKNDKYLYFGRPAAKLDDVVNFLPSRICAWFMIGVSFLGGFRGKDALRIYLRDRKNHASPNSAQTEAVMAGALGVQLAGDAWYFGKKHEKPTIGDGIRPVERQDIKRANQLMYRTAWIGIIVCVGIRAIVCWY